jgi:hypothetical protein
VERVNVPMLMHTRSKVAIIVLGGALLASSPRGSLDRAPLTFLGLCLANVCVNDQYTPVLVSCKTRHLACYPDNSVLPFPTCS